MKQQSQFIKLPGERVNTAQVEAGIQTPETYPAFFWIDRADIRAVMEAQSLPSEDMNVCTIFCQNGDSFHCTLPAEKVMAKIDQHDREANIVYFQSQ